jgi:hypothetical protein
MGSQEKGWSNPAFFLGIDEGESENHVLLHNYPRPQAALRVP